MRILLCPGPVAESDQKDPAAAGMDACIPQIVHRLVVLARCWPWHADGPVWFIERRHTHNWGRGHQGGRP